MGGAGVLLHLKRAELDVVDGWQDDATAVLPDPRKGGLCPAEGTGHKQEPSQNPQQPKEGAPLTMSADPSTRPGHGRLGLQGMANPQHCPDQRLGLLDRSVLGSGTSECSRVSHGPGVVQRAFLA